MTLDYAYTCTASARARHDAIIACARIMRKFITWKEGGPGTACVCDSCVCSPKMSHSRRKVMHSALK